MGRKGSQIDAEGNIYIVDRGNRRIRKVDTAGIITTVVGSGETGLPLDGMEASNAPLGDPYAVAVGAEGDMYIADTVNHRIFKLTEKGRSRGDEYPPRN